MKITVQAAQFVRHRFFSRCRISDSVKQLLGSSNPQLKLQACGALYQDMGDNMINQNVNENKVDKNIFDHIYPYCNEEERRKLRLSLYKGQFTERVSSSCSLTVESSMTIGDLKLSLKQEPWFPQENLLLFQYRSRPIGLDPLDNDNAELDYYGIKEGGRLIACMDGSFPLTVYDVEGDEEYFIPIEHCFETIDDVKKKIYVETGLHPDDQRLFCDGDRVSDLKCQGIPLVAFGIVRPHFVDIMKSSQRIDLHMPDLEKKKWE